MIAQADRRFAFVAFLLLLFTANIKAQVAGGQGNVTRLDLGGGNSIDGIVVGPEGAPISRGLRIRLSRAGVDATIYADEYGRFKIAGLSEGSYLVSVEAGDDIEPQTQQVDISFQRTGLPQTYSVSFRMRYKKGVAAKPGVLEADLAGVPDDAVEFYRKAAAAAAKGDTKRAVEELLAAVAVHPDFMLAHAELGVQYQKINDLDKADEHLRTALKLKPDAYEPLANRGIVLVRLRKYADAEPLLRGALKQKDESAVVHFYLGRSMLGQKRPDDAEAEFRTAFEKGGNDMIEARRALATIYLDRGENEKGLKEIEAYLAVNPKPADEAHLRETVRQIKEWIKANKKP